MTETAARPWWADVQHLRPREDREAAKPAAARSWADDAGFTDAVGDREAFGSAATGSAATRSAATRSASADTDFAGFDSAVAVLDFPTVEDALSAVDRPLPIDFDVDDVDWTPTRRPAREVLDERDWTPARRFARAAGAALAGGRDRGLDARMMMPAAAPPPAPAQPAIPDFADAFDAEPARRTVSIRGQVDARATAPATGQAAGGGRHRRQRATAAERIAGRPDRIALWAVILGVVLILVAAFSAPGAEAALLGA